MALETAIQKLGFDEKAAALYVAALALGEASMTQLAKRAALKRPTAYLAVEELQHAGLLSGVTKGKRQVYSAVHPRRLLEIAQAREQHIADVLPELVAQYNAPTAKPRIQVFEGTDGLERVYDALYRALSSKQEALWFTRIDALRDHFPAALSLGKQVLRKVRDARIRELNLDNEAGRAWIEETASLRGSRHYVRLLPVTFPLGFTDNLIFENKLVIFSLKVAVFVIVIESEDIAQTYRALFEWAWKMGREES